jgi:hypothetical protein
MAFRNRAVRDVVLPKAAELGAEWALFIDNDVTITHPGVETFLALDGDLVSCHCRMRTPAAWSAENSFHTTFWFARIEIFRALPPPWFRFVYSDDGCEMLQCECQFFRDRVLASGFSVQSGGWCGHGCEAKWCG